MMHIVRDAREKTGYTFEGRGVKLSIGTLETGDYTLAGCEHLVAVERKTIPDLIMCLGRERSRFERELRRARSLEAFAVVVEGTWEHLSAKRYRAQMDSHAAMQTIMAFSVRYRCQFLFCGDIYGEFCTFNFLRHYLRGKKRYLEVLTQAASA